MVDTKSKKSAIEPFFLFAADADADAADKS